MLHWLIPAVFATVFLSIFAKTYFDFRRFGAHMGYVGWKGFLGFIFNYNVISFRRWLFGAAFYDRPSDRKTDRENP